MHWTMGCIPIVMGSDVAVHSDLIFEGDSVIENPESGDDLQGETHVPPRWCPYLGQNLWASQFTQYAGGGWKKT
jgi:hypothetical protein